MTSFCQVGFSGVVAYQVLLRILSVYMCTYLHCYDDKRDHERDLAFLLSVTRYQHLLCAQVLNEWLSSHLLGNMLLVISLTHFILTIYSMSIDDIYETQY